MKEKLQIPPGHDGRIWWHVNLGNTYPMHRHDELELNLVTAGRAVYLLKDRKYEMQAGTLVWLFPAQDHVLVEQSPDYAMWIAVFTPAVLRRVCKSADYRPLTQANPKVTMCGRLPALETRRLETLMRDGVAAWDEEDVPRFNAAIAYLALTAWMSHQSSRPIAGNNVHPAVDRAIKMIRDETEPVKLSVLAEHAGLSPSRLSTLFKLQTGIPLVRFRQTQQLDRFFREYQSGDRTMLSAALAAGFGSYPQFHRVFKNVMGYGPAEFRRRESQPASRVSLPSPTR